MPAPSQPTRPMNTSVTEHLRLRRGDPRPLARFDGTSVLEPDPAGRSYGCRTVRLALAPTYLRVRSRQSGPGVPPRSPGAVIEGCDHGQSDDHDAERRAGS